MSIPMRQLFKRKKLPNQDLIHRDKMDSLFAEFLGITTADIKAVGYMMMQDAMVVQAYNGRIFTIYGDVFHRFLIRRAKYDPKYPSNL